MKTDEEAQVRACLSLFKGMMISSEAPMIFAKACEIFILELTMRAWANTEECRRRTLQRADVAAAVHGADMYDCKNQLIMPF